MSSNIHSFSDICSLLVYYLVSKSSFVATLQEQKDVYIVGELPEEGRSITHILKLTSEEELGLSFEISWHREEGKGECLPFFSFP